MQFFLGTRFAMLSQDGRYSRSCLQCSGNKATSGGSGSVAVCQLTRLRSDGHDAHSIRILLRTTGRIHSPVPRQYRTRKCLVPSFDLSQNSGFFFVCLFFLQI